ncbi:hypothetical protein LT126_000887 [Enterococcus faecalis]|nr:hypothetical protein [Enterococcus faecalis]
MSKQELVDKNDVLSIWHNYWESDKSAYEAEDELRELKTIICITELNENQQTVLDWLKKHFYKEDDNYPLVSVCRFVEEDIGDEFSDVGLAYGYLTMKQEAQVLLAFANWTMEQEEE